MKRTKGIAFLACVLLAFFAVALSGCERMHTHAWGAKEETAATCEKEGSKVYQCDCGATKVIQIQALGHIWTAVDEKLPTCQQEGWRAYENCSRCGEGGKEILGKLPHVWVEIDRDETAVYYECENCWEGKTESLIPDVIPDSSSSEIEDTDSSSSSSAPTDLEDSSSDLDSSDSIDSSDSSDSVDSSISADSSSNDDSSDSADSSNDDSSQDSSSSDVTSGDGADDEPTEETPPTDERTALEEAVLIYQIASNGKSYICTGAENAMTLRKVVIPDEHGGKPVTEVAEGAFQECLTLTCVYLGKNLEKLGANAFFRCYNLTEVHNYYGLNLDGAEGETSSGITDNAIAVYTTPTTSKITCDQEGYITYTTTEEKRLLGYAGAGTELTLPSDLTHIHRGIFAQIQDLKSVVIGDGVTELRSYVFENCESLESVTIGKGVGYISIYAFKNCAALSKIYFGETSGWYIKNGEEFSAEELADPKRAARYLTMDYLGKSWYRAE